MTEIKTDNLVYFDPEFIAKKYEDVKGYAPSSQLTRTEGMKAGLNIPVLSAGVHTQETRTYPLSSFGMLKEIYESLRDYSFFDAASCQSIIRPQIVWVQGNITVSVWRNSKDETEKYPYFQMVTDGSESDFSLIVKEEYMASGYDSLLKVSPVIQNNISIPVSALVKILYCSMVAKSFVSTPILIIEKDPNL